MLIEAKILERNNPDAPWLVQDSILFLDEWLQNDMKGFEFDQVAQLNGLQREFRFIFQLKVTLSGIKIN